MNSIYPRKIKRNFLKSAALAISLAALAGCASAPKEFKATPIPRAELKVPPVDKVKTAPVEWSVYSRRAKPGQPGSIEEIHKKMDREKTDSAFLLTPENYKRLSENIAKGQQLTLQQQAQIRAYRRYYGRQNELLDDYEKKQNFNKK